MIGRTAFKRTIWSYYKQHGRDLPWRKTADPYRVLVSELMLQQTQVARVLSKYHAFLKRFPDICTLAEAPLRDVLGVWQGLGYNRRAKMLHELAKDADGTLPNTYEGLLSLPGIGPYTAAAIMNFAHGVATPMIETNIRTVYIHYFFNDREKIADKEIMEHVEATMDRTDPKNWFNALMDHGAMLKSGSQEANIKSASYRKQPAFKGSRREARGEIIRLLSKRKRVDERILAVHCAAAQTHIPEALAALVREGILVKKGRFYSLP